MTKHTTSNTVRLATSFADARTLGLIAQANVLILAYEPSMGAHEQVGLLHDVQSAVESLGGADGYRDQVEALRMATLRELHTILGRINWVIAA